MAPGAFLPHGHGDSARLRVAGRGGMCWQDGWPRGAEGLRGQLRPQPGRDWVGTGRSQQDGLQQLCCFPCLQIVFASPSLGCRQQKAFAFLPHRVGLAVWPFSWCCRAPGSHFSPRVAFPASLTPNLISVETSTASKPSALSTEEKAVLVIPELP